jgi:FkbM family methyltransferase
MNYLSESKMPSLRNTIHRFNIILLGAGIRDKARLFLTALIESNPLSRKVFSNKINLFNLIINVGVSKFRIKDRTSFFVLSSSYEELNMENLNLQHGNVFIDVGAHIGKYTVKAARDVGTRGKVISVEPFPSNFAVLKENISLNNLKNVELVNAAGWNCSKQLRFFIGASSAHGGLYFDYDLNSIWVKAEKIDRIIADAKLSRVDWIKIDVEGAEYEVLQGLEETLDRFKPRLLVEVWQKNQFKVENLLSKHNYVMRRASEGGTFRKDSYSDYLCTKTN